MKRRLLISLMALATMGVSAGLASSASATVLCKTASIPCSGGVYGQGSVLQLQLKANTYFTFGFPYPSVYNACSEAAIKGVVETAPETGTVAGSVSYISFGGCTAPVTVTKTGGFSVSYAKGSNGVLSLEGFELKAGNLNCLFIGPAPLAVLGGEMGTAAINSFVPHKLGALCPEKLTWTAEFTVTAPEPLYVAEA